MFLQASRLLARFQTDRRSFSKGPNGSVPPTARRIHPPQMHWGPSCPEVVAKCLLLPEHPHLCIDSFRVVGMAT